MVSADRWGLSCVLLAFGLALGTGAPPASAAGWADRMFPEKSHDFRIVGRGAKAQYHFEFTNHGTQTLHVASVRSSCGCTTPTITKDTLKPGQSSSIRAQFNTSSFIGQKSATITVVFDRPAFAEVRLKVTGFIRTDITFNPAEVDFGEVTEGSASEREVTITHTGNPNWTIKDVRSHCKNLQVRLRPAKRMENQVQYRMLVRLDDTMPTGEIRERLTLISNNASFPTTEMSISGRVISSLTVSPASVLISRASSTGTIEKRLIVKGAQPFEILDVQCEDRRFEFEVPKGKQKVQFVMLRFHGDGTNKPIRDEIRVVTNLPGNKSATCLVTGNVTAGK